MGTCSYVFGFSKIYFVMMVASIFSLLSQHKELNSEWRCTNKNYQNVRTCRLICFLVSHPAPLSWTRLTGHILPFAELESERYWQDRQINYPHQSVSTVRCFANSTCLHEVRLSKVVSCQKCGVWKLRSFRLLNAHILSKSHLMLLTFVETD